MDIRNNKNRLHTKIKHFTLTAIASAVLTLHAETAMAANCPTEIVGNALAGIICNFNGIPPSGSSVTVKNGGTVGGILMSSYQPTNSFITINAGGQVSNTTGIGIAVTNNSSLSNGLSNSGTISAQSGIGITANSVINGGISNSGLISTVNADISVSTSTVSNGLSNTGTISSTSGVGISILNTSTINGGIFNSGVIGASITGITMSGNSTISGDIFNSGTINSNIATGIRIATSAISGGIVNSGTISGSGVDSGMSIMANSTIRGNITNQGLINATTGNAIALSLSVINGGISNTGRITSTKGDGIHLGNVSTIQGNITNSGTLSGGQNGISLLSTSTVGGIVNSGTISSGNNGLNISSSTINGSITNTGTISGGTTGLNISNTATISGGISNSGTIQGNIFAINITSSNVNNIDMLGKSARIIGAVNAINTNVNITNGATFTSEGTYNVNTFNIAQNAIFNMANSITVAAGLNNGGTLAVTNSLQTITGDYTQNTGSIFQTNLSSTSNYGQLSVNGTANLSQSGNIYVQVGQNASIHAGDIFSNVISGNTFTTPTSGFNVSNNSFIWQFSALLNKANNGVNLTAAINPAAYNVCQGTYCQGVLNTIIGQVAAGNSLFAPYSTLSTASALQTAASQATPELTNENIQTMQLITQAVTDIAPMWNNLRGKSAGDTMLYQPGSIWIKPYGASMTQNQHNTVNGFNATAYGAVIGRDIEFNNNVLVGGAVAAGGDNMYGKSALNNQSINSKAYQVMLYGAKKFPNQVYLAGQGLVGYETNNSRRTIPLYASTAKGSYNSWFTNLHTEAGWRITPFSPNLVFTPEIDASYLFIHQGSYRESGSLMDLSVATNKNSSLVLGATCNGAYHLATIKNHHDLTLTGYAGVAKNVINSQPQVSSTFVAGGSRFSTSGVQFNGLVLRRGIGLAMTSQTNPLIVELNYDVQSGNNAYSNTGTATIKYEL